MAVSRIHTAATALVFVAATGCAGTRQSPEQPTPRAVSRYPHTQADVRFMSAMIGHHGQALAMAALAPTNGAGPEILRLAERITAGQQDEIASMRQWLTDRGEPVPDAHHAMHGHAMPGMLTEDQMQELAQARGPAFDRLFLTYMIQHHQGAVTMVRDLFATPGAAREETTFKLASDISADQSSEIKRMRRMLAELPSKSSP